MAKPRGTTRRLIDPRKETVLPLRQLARLIPDEPHYTTVLGWCTVGKETEAGAVVVMESIEMTYGKGSTLDAFWRFIERLNEE